MKKLLAVAALTACAAQAQALTLPTDLVGIWGRPESVFADGLIKKGGAIYLDADGQGVSAASDGSSVIGVRLIVKSYEPDSGKLVVDFQTLQSVIANRYDVMAKYAKSVKRACRLPTSPHRSRKATRPATV